MLAIHFLPIGPKSVLSGTFNSGEICSSVLSGGQTVQAFLNLIPANWQLLVADMRLNINTPVISENQPMHWTALQAVSKKNPLNPFC